MSGAEAPYLVSEYINISHHREMTVLKTRLPAPAFRFPAIWLEGAERRSDKDSRHFFNIAKGSCAELYTQVFIGKEIGYIDEPEASEIIGEIEQISAMIAGLIKHTHTTS